MKKFFVCLSMLLLASLLALGVFATETVIYENDFSDPATLSDFKQYCMEWEIRDGGLYLTEDTVMWSHIIYQMDKTLSDYIVEVDYMNVQTAGGIIFRADQAKVDEQQNGFYGYVAFLSNDATKGALGSANNSGGWKGNIHIGAKKSNVSEDVHIKVTVRGKIIQVEMTNIHSGATVYENTYTIGTSALDQIWNSGTVGLRMRSKNDDIFTNSVGNAYFDNFKVTALGNTSGTPSDNTPAAPAATGILADTTLTEVYRNTFDNADALGDFLQFRGTWEIRDGRLYLAQQTEGAQSYILYNGGDALTQLTDYVVDVDMYNIQTQGGIIARSELASVTGDTDDGIMGYLGFVSNDGKKGALGAGQSDGKWLEGNIAVGPVIMQPGANIHMQMAVKGKTVQLTVSDLDTGAVLWTQAKENTLWAKGTFGFRLRGKATNAGLNNLGLTEFDNLIVSTITEAKPAEPVQPDTPAAEPTTAPAEFIDTTNLVEVYRNGFDDVSALAEFTQYRGTWNVHEGRLYLSALKTGTHSYILYEGDRALTQLTDYVVDVDVYSIQTQGGLIARSDLASVTGDTDDGIMGYLGFTSNYGTQGALGTIVPGGKWMNIEVGPTILEPGRNIHLQFAVKGTVVQLTVTDLDTGEMLWKHAESIELWEKGSFGIRMRGKPTNAGLDNINTTAYDNLVVSTYGEPVAKTEVKLQIDSLTGYVNGEAKELDAAPVIRNDRTMLPVRFVAENLGGTVGWDGATRTVTVSTATTTLEIKIDSDVAKVNGVEITLDSPAFIENDRTYLPVRFVAEKLGATVEWDGTTRTATLIK